MSAAASDASETQVPAKEDPETLVLRGRPRPVVRFRRGVIIGVSATMATGVAIVAWLALAPAGLRQALIDDDAEAVVAQPRVPEALAGAPSSYADAPRLGAELPGDLGRPILEHQRGLEPGPEAVSRPPVGEPDPAEQAMEAERQRRAAERRSVRSSSVLVQLSGTASATARPGGERYDTQTAGPAPAAIAAQSSATGLRSAASPWTLSAGAVIPASLLTGLNSDTPGTVIAQVTENVRDSATGRTVLIPQGARLIGSYDSVVAYGQSRAMLVWQRIVLPDGASLALDNLPAADTAGYSGVADGVDGHIWRLLKGIALSTLLGVGTEIGLGSNEGDLVRALREATQQDAARVGGQITARNLEVRPTITVRPGWPVRAIVNKDLVLQPWKA